jgi:hypothetical protein
MRKSDIRYFRLLNQSVVNSQCTDPVGVVKSLGAVQAQDYGQALWAIGLRTKGAKLQDVVDAVESGKILRTWPMRGTIHFVPAEDAKWMVSLVGERTMRSAASRYAQLQLSDADFRKAEEIIRGALSGGKRLTRLALMQLLEDAHVGTKEQRGYHIIGALSLMGVLCIGPMDGKQQTYTLLDEWAPNGRELSREEGLGELARRYFRGHGPATVADFATWSSQPQRDAKIGLELAKGDLVSEVIDGVEYWMNRNIPAIDHEAVRDTYLLAGFEEYLLGYKDRTAVIDNRRATASTVNGIFFPIIVADGRVVGIWKRVIKPKNIVVSFQPFEPLSERVMREARAKAEAYGEFMGLPIVFQDS